jgi:hypothetical protein
MSLDKMSAAVRSHIVSRITEVITKGSVDSLTERKLKTFESYTSRDQIRKDTDTVGGRHESIMSRGAFTTLLEDMSKAIAEKELSDQLSFAVQNASFDGFVSYISDIYYKDKEFLLTDNRRVKNGFIYSGPTRNTTESVAVFAKSQESDNSFKDVLLLKNIPQGKLVSYYTDYITENTPGITNEIKAQLKKSLQGGHLTGVFTARLIRAFGLRKDSAGQVKFNTSSKQLTDLEKQLGAVVDLVTNADFLSSNIALDINLFTETDKRLYSNAAEIRLTTEVQFAKSNKEAGDLLTTAGTYLSKLISSVKPNISNAAQEKSAQEAFKKLLANLQKVSLYVKDRAEQLQKLNSSKQLDPKLQQKLVQILQSQQTFETLLNTEGSPSVLDHITTMMANAITGKVTKGSKSSILLKNKIPLGTKSAKSRVQKPNTKKKTPLKFKEPPLKFSSAQQISLSSLQLLLNANLTQTIKQNMGDGSRRDILNLRSGRFAESVKVERLSESRAGMVTAFYSYMKNPYATFSDGGKQSSPKSRNPKLLISKSIREIAAEQVANRLRAVAI